jgi:hypothetical protein
MQLERSMQGINYFKKKRGQSCESPVSACFLMLRQHGDTLTISSLFVGMVMHLAYNLTNKLVSRFLNFCVLKMVQYNCRVFFRTYI